MSTTSSIPVPGTTSKVKRLDVKKIEAVSIKPPIVVADPDGGDNHVYMCVYVSARFQPVKTQCTFDVWKRCEGRQTPGKPRDGLESRLYNDFIMVHNAEGMLVDIDIIPKTYYAARAMLPDNLVGKDDIVVKIMPKTGSLEVLQCPAGVTKASVIRLLNQLDKLDSIQTGDIIPGGFEVINVSGNQVSIIPISDR